MKNLILLFISFLMIPTTGNGQDILDGAYDRKTTYENRKVQPYPHLRQADVMWSRKIWREIDLREKVNHPFYGGFTIKRISNSYPSKVNSVRIEISSKIRYNSDNQQNFIESLAEGLIIYLNQSNN